LGLCRLEKRPSKAGKRVYVHLLYPFDRCQYLISSRGGSLAPCAIRIAGISADLILLPIPAVLLQA
jgi:hypothetical protein